MNLIDLSKLPPPSVVEPLDFETIFAEMLADLRSRHPSFSALVESDPAYKLLEIAAYRELLLRQRVNDAARAVMLAYAAGADLDQMAARYGVARLVVTPGDPSALPPVAPVYEPDDEFRYRVILSLEGYTTAGSRGSYVFHGLSASGDCKDIGVASLSPGAVNIAVLSRTGNGVAPESTVQAVTDALSAETVRPLCDTVVVESAAIVPYTITATLTVSPGAGRSEVLACAIAAAEAYAAAQHRLGKNIALSGIFAALHQSGVQNVQLSAPAEDVAVAWNQAAWCDGIAVGIAGEE